MKKKTYFVPLLLGGMLLLSGCHSPESSEEPKMKYIKSSTLYQAIMDIYADPDAHLGKTYHMVGTLYPSQDDDGETFYSIYAEPPGGGEGTGLELDWSDYSGVADYDKVTVEGTLEKQKRKHHGEEDEFVILKVSMLEKRS